MFMQGKKANIEEIYSRKDKVTVCKIRTFRMNYRAKAIQIDFCEYVVFMKDAHNKYPEAGQKIRLKACGVTTPHINGKFKAKYWVFDYDIVEDTPANKEIAEREKKKADEKERIEKEYADNKDLFIDDEDEMI